MIVFDIGNTDTVVGFYKEEVLINVLRIRSLKNENAVFFEYRLLNFMLENGLDKASFKKVVISSVVPILTPFFINFSKNFLHLDPILVNVSKSNLLKINIDYPEELGSDLFVNALSAFSQCKKSCIVVDFGTALTFTSVSDGGEILGVSIVPGIKTAVKSLFSQTSLLPEVKLEKPATIIGKNSMHSIQSGIIYGYESLVNGVVSKIKNEMGGHPTVFATGGLSSILKDIKHIFDYIDPELTLKGLMIYGNSYK
jgi:type III pantothenate kinase